MNQLVDIKTFNIRGPMTEIGRFFQDFGKPILAFSIETGNSQRISSRAIVERAPSPERLKFPRENAYVYQQDAVAMSRAVIPGLGLRYESRTSLSAHFRGTDLLTSLMELGSLTSISFFSFVQFSSPPSPFLDPLTTRCEQ